MHPKNLTSPKIIYWSTPVIRGIIVSTVNSVKWRTLTMWYPRKENLNG